MKKQRNQNNLLKKDNLPWKFRTDFKQEDIEYLTHLHGVLYAKEYSFDETFKDYVAQDLNEFTKSFDPNKDRLWLAEAGTQIIGAIAVVGNSNEGAPFRWFIVHPDYRKKGLGTELIKKAFDFCKEHKYKNIFLWTTSELRAAASLYIRAGFKKTEEKTHLIWGKEVAEERYELHL